MTGILLEQAAGAAARRGRESGGVRRSSPAAGFAGPRRPGCRGAASPLQLASRETVTLAYPMLASSAERAPSAPRFAAVHDDDLLQIAHAPSGTRRSTAAGQCIKRGRPTKVSGGRGRISARRSRSRRRGRREKPERRQRGTGPCGASALERHDLGGGAGERDLAVVLAPDVEERRARRVSPRRARGRCARPLLRARPRHARSPKARTSVTRPPSSPFPPKRSGGRCTRTVLMRGLRQPGLRQGRLEERGGDEVGRSWRVEGATNCGAVGKADAFESDAGQERGDEPRREALHDRPARGGCTGARQAGSPASPERPPPPSEPSGRDGTAARDPRRAPRR